MDYSLATSRRYVNITSFLWSRLYCPFWFLIDVRTNHPFSLSSLISSLIKVPLEEPQKEIVEESSASNQQCNQTDDHTSEKDPACTPESAGKVRRRKKGKTRSLGHWPFERLPSKEKNVLKRKSSSIGDTLFDAMLDKEERRSRNGENSMPKRDTIKRKGSHTSALEKKVHKEAKKKTKKKRTPHPDYKKAPHVRKGWNLSSLLIASFVKKNRSFVKVSEKIFALLTLT